MNAFNLDIISMKKTATIILNRNLPKPTDDLVESSELSLTEIILMYLLLEAGSDRE